MSDYPIATDQLPLFENPQAPRKSVSLQASRENKAAAYKASKPTHGKQCQAVLMCVRNRGKDGCTRKEIAAALDIPLSAACGRVNELLNEPQPKVFQDKAFRRDGGMVVFAKGEM